jgi:proline iminopeptidase
MAALVLARVAAAADASPVREGFVQVPGGPVWYRIVGSGPGTPLMIVHGGPGSRSCAYDPLAALLSRDRPVIVYDQLGSGRSGRPTDPSLWTLDRSVRELAAVRKALGLKKVHLMGHSWGGGLVAAYVVNGHPGGVESLVLAGPLLSTRRWIEDANILRAQLPEEVQDVLARNERAGTTGSREYEDAANAFYSRFLYHQPNVARPPSCAESYRNDEIYRIMWGPSEFTATGNLLTFDVTQHLERLTMPVAFFIGRYDEARVETMQDFQARIPGSILRIFENSGHMAPLEEYSAYADTLGEFLRDVDARDQRRRF